jgi:hypothetical protein
MAPEFSEGWNKRATVRHLTKDFFGLLRDCQETLARNPNHFTAASGQASVTWRWANTAKPRSAFARLCRIYPHLAAVRQNLALAEAQGDDRGGNCISPFVRSPSELPRVQKKLTKLAPML